MVHVPGSRVRLALVLSAAVLAIGCGGGSTPSSPSPPGAPFSQTDQRVGTGAEATAGKRLFVHYSGWLYDPTQPEQKGRRFDTSVGGQPFAFTLGAGGVIRGWDQGVAGMKVGGQRRLVIPPELAYGSQGAGGGTIPPNATLVFDIELLDVQG
ncbi:MAG: FKBP-type peptidyl-prolyl cis-trans isomerase [Acidobacteria bacterium]|nr:FKBP-type peptidyl-prolyl cis-trans isomerase [Acidobacteriota bacterium]